jgi:DNA-binding NarL/FixJ family response regulator
VQVNGGEVILRGTAAVPRLKRTGSGADDPSPMLTSFADHDVVLEAIDAGTVGYLLKDADPQETASDPRDRSNRGAAASGPAQPGRDVASSG